MKLFLLKIQNHFPYLLILWILPAAVYFRTLQPSWYLIDAGVSIDASYILGIPTPPGYPSFTLISHFFSLLPWGSVLFRLQIFSILVSLGILTLVYVFLNRLLTKDLLFLEESRSDELIVGETKSINPHLIRLITLGSSLVLAFSYQFWSQTLNFEPYLFTDLILIGVLTILSYTKLGEKELFKSSLVIAFLIGLASGGSTVVMFMILPALIILVFKYWRYFGLKKTIMISLSIILATALVYSYLPLRARMHPFLNWGDPETPQLFLQHVQGAGLSYNDPITGKVTGFTGSPSVFISSLGRFFYLVSQQFGYLLLILVPLGAFYIYKKNKTMFWTLSSIPIMAVILGGLWSSGNQESWYLMSFIVFDLMLGVGSIYLIKLIIIKKPQFAKLDLLKKILLVLIILALSVKPLVNWFQKLDRSKEFATLDYADNLYANLPKNSVIIGLYDTFNAATLYKHDISKERSDVFPIMTNEMYVLPWYRADIRLINKDLMPLEIDSMIHYDRESEYNDLLNYYVDQLLKKGYPVYVNQLVFRDSVLVGSQAGVFTPDPKKFKQIPFGLLVKIVPADSKDEAQESSFNYKFRTDLKKGVPFYLEKGYTSNYQILIDEYAQSYLAMADYFTQQDQHPQPSGGFGNTSLPPAVLAQLNKGSSSGVNNKAKALEYLNKAYDLSPHSLEVVNRLAIYYATDGNFTKALDFFKQAVELDPTNLSLKFNLAKAYQDSGQFDKAKETYQNVLSSTPDDSDLAKAATEKLSNLGTSPRVPKGWGTYSDPKLNLSFNYPDGFSINSDFAVNTIKLSNNLTGKDELTMMFYTRKMGQNQGIDDVTSELPFAVDGVLLGTQPGNISGFASELKTYGSGAHTTMLFVLKRDTQGFAIKVYPGDSNKGDDFVKILGSVKTIVQ